MGLLLRAPRRDAVAPDGGVGPADLSPAAPAVVPLDQAALAGSAVVGAKAANLGRALAAGLPVLPGFAVTTDAVAALMAGPAAVSHQVRRALLQAWADLAGHGGPPLVVRSSSPVEDQSGSSMAGCFTSVVDVRGWDAFLDAVKAVARSAHRAGSAPAPMAVLVQPHLEPRLAGVLFGLDPVSGRHDRRVVAAVEGGPQRLVSGEVDGTRYLLGPRGRLIEMDGEPLALHARDRRALTGLARRTALVFGGPQDIEWALADDGRWWLLQARPITTVAPGAVRGPVFGPGPVAETFPDPLGPLEEDLWVPPLRRALAESLHLTGAASRRAVTASPIVVTVGGRVAADLALLGVGPGRRSLWARIDPRPPVRRLRAAWTVGRLRAALPGLAADLNATLDAELGAVPALAELPDDGLLVLLERAGEALVSVHGYEMLAGLLPAPTVGAASLALDALAYGRAHGMADADIVAARPVVLALTPPAVAGGLGLPDTRPASDRSSAAGPEGARDRGPHRAQSATTFGPRTLESLEPREALRLRARWLHELTVRVARELGGRLAVRGLLADPDDVGLLRLADLHAAVQDGAPLHAAVRDGAPLHADIGDGASSGGPAGDGRRPRLSPPLPPAFRLGPDSRVVAVETAADRHSRHGRHEPEGRQGRGAAPGRGAGVVHDGPLPAPEGSVLVVSTLDPGLAPYLPGLAGLVAETGSVLSHLAILAREFGVPCVVAYPGALERFPAGTAVMVDGTTGEVAALGPAGR